MTTSAPVTPGEVISLELVIWDTGDAQYDSSVRLDHLRWLASTASTPVTTPAPPL